jgi:hypothetical protein
MPTREIAATMLRMNFALLQANARRGRMQSADPRDSREHRELSRQDLVEEPAALGECREC